MRKGKLHSIPQGHVFMWDGALNGTFVTGQLRMVFCGDCCMAVVWLFLLLCGCRAAAVWLLCDCCVTVVMCGCCAVWLLGGGCVASV
jgi:hypothetical protein